MLNQTSVNASTNTTITSETKTETTKHRWVYVVLLMSGKLAIGSADNASRAIAKLNSGMCKAVPESNCVYQIVGVKEVNETRNLPSVVERFCSKYGDDRVIAL